jgi:hypothetical protein
MKPEEGIAHIAIGLGKTVVEGERALRFSPKYPNMLPQFSTVDDILANAQRFFYALRLRDCGPQLSFAEHCNLEKRALDEAENEFPVKMLSSTYVPEEHRIRDSVSVPGYRVVTFAPFSSTTSSPCLRSCVTFWNWGRKGMGCPVEIEFSVNLRPTGNAKETSTFSRCGPWWPMTSDSTWRSPRMKEARAFCRSSQALGNGKNNEIADILYVKPKDFKPESTVEMARKSTA